MGQRKHAAEKIAATVDERMLSTRELLERLPLNRATVWKMVQEGRFPAPVQITASRIAWRLTAVLAWLADREANPVEARAYFGRRSKRPARRRRNVPSSDAA